MACGLTCFTDQGEKICMHPSTSTPVNPLPSIIDLDRKHTWNEAGFCVTCRHGKSYCVEHNISTCPVDLSKILSKAQLDIMGKIKDSAAAIDMHNRELQRNLADLKAHQIKVDEYRKKIDENNAKIMSCVVIIHRNKVDLCNSLQTSLDIEPVEQQPSMSFEIGRTE